MFKWRKNKKADVDLSLETQVIPTQADVQVPRKGKKKKSLLHGLRATSWNIIREEVFADSYAVRALTHAYGLMVTNALLETGDDSVGLFIHHVGKGKIKAMVTDELIAAGYFVLLLDRETLLIVEEYPFVWTAGLEAVRIDSDGEVTPLGLEYTPSDILLFVNGEVDLMIAGEQLGAGGPVAEDTWEGANEVDDWPIVESAFEPEDVPALDAAVFAPVDEPTQAADMWVPDDGFNDGPIDEDLAFVLPVMDEVEEAESASDEGVEILAEADTAEQLSMMTKEAVEQVIRRVFSEGDLDLVVDPQLFDTQFAEDTLVLFAENRGDGILEQCVAQMSREANQKMRHLYQVNRALLRDKFMVEMGRVCSGVLDHTDLNNPNTGMGQEFAALNESRRAQFSALDTKAAEQIAQLDADWNRELGECGEQARDSAVANHKRRHGYRHEAKRAAVRGELERTIHQGYEYGAASLNVKRKGVARRLMDAGTNHTLAELSKLYAELLREEAALRGRLETEIVAYVRDYHEDDLSRTRVLEQEMLQKTKAQQVQEEYEVKLGTLMGDLERQAALYDTERQRFVDELSALAKSKDTYHKEYVATVEARYKAYDEELALMRQDMVRLDARKSDEHAHQLNVFKDALGASQTQVDLEMTRSKRWNRISFAIVFGVAIVTMTLGILIGVLASTHLFLR